MYGSSYERERREERRAAIRAAPVHTEERDGRVWLVRVLPATAGPGSCEPFCVHGRTG